MLWILKIPRYTAPYGLLRFNYFLIIVEKENVLSLITFLKKSYERRQTSLINRKNVFLSKGHYCIKKKKKLFHELSRIEITQIYNISKFVVHTRIKKYVNIPTRFSSDSWLGMQSDFKLFKLCLISRHCIQFFKIKIKIQHTIYNQERTNQNGESARQQCCHGSWTR